jgi:hypothetical protein
MKKQIGEKSKYEVFFPMVVGIFVGALFWIMIFFRVPINNFTTPFLSPGCLISELDFLNFSDLNSRGVCAVFFGLPFNVIIYGLLGIIIGVLLGIIKSKLSKKK